MFQYSSGLPNEVSPLANDEYSAALTQHGVLEIASAAFGFDTAMHHESERRLFATVQPLSTEMEILFSHCYPCFDDIFEYLVTKFRMYNIKAPIYFVWGSNAPDTVQSINKYPNVRA